MKRDNRQFAVIQFIPAGKNSANGIPDAGICHTDLTSDGCELTIKRLQEEEISTNGGLYSSYVTMPTKIAKKIVKLIVDCRLNDNL